MIVQPAAGLHRVGDGGTDAGRAFRAAGWRVVPVPVGGTGDDLYAALAAGLELPSWFGANLDALWDSLAELAGPTALLLTRWSAYAAAEPVTWDRFLELVAERAALEPPFAVLLA